MTSPGPGPSASGPCFPGFDSGPVEVDGSAVYARWAGRGPAVLLLHGFPETHLMWRDVTPVLAER